MPSSEILINLVIYQACWLSCILGGAHGMPWLGVIVVALAVTFHLFGAMKPVSELLLILSAVAVGAVWDSLLVGFGWLIYPSGILIEYTAPYWIVALWAGFATTFNVSLAWFKTRLLMSALLGALGGPLAYLAGERLGAVEFSSQIAAMVALALGWAVIMPLMMCLARRLNGIEVESGKPASAPG